MRTARMALVGLLAFSGLPKARADFSIQNIQCNPDGSITLTWPVTPTVTYHVLRADALDGSWQEFPDGQLTAGTKDSTLCYTDTSAAATPQRFYKVSRDPAQLVMTLVLDASGSMGVLPPIGIGGGAYLPGAVQTFIANFNDSFDRAALVTFSTIPRNVVYTGYFPSSAQPTQPFRADISSAVNTLTYSGGTFSQSGLTNALVMENNAAPSGFGTVKVVVFFTDGMANIVQDTLDCHPPTLLNFGGVDLPSNWYYFFDPVTGSNVNCSATQFKSAIDGTMKTLNRVNITADAEYRSVQLANDMRANNIIVFSVGLGGGVNTTFLQQIANDPAVPGYVATPYDGVAVVANDPTQLVAALQAIASQILSRAGR